MVWVRTGATALNSSARYFLPLKNMNKTINISLEIFGKSVTIILQISVDETSNQVARSELYSLP